MTPAVRFRDMSSGQGAASALPICGLFLQKLYKTPQYAALKTEKFAEPAKWIKDSMDCEPRIYAPGELDDGNAIDTTGVVYPAGFFDEKPASSSDPNDLREKPSGNNNNAPQPDKTSATTPPSAKPDVKTTPAKPEVKPPTTSGKSMLPKPPPLSPTKPSGQ